MLPSFDTLEKLDDDENVDAVEVESVVMMPIHVNANSSVFSDVRVRQALGYAIDRTHVRDVVFGGHASIFQGGVIPPTLRGFDPEYKLFPETADIEKAKTSPRPAHGTGPVHHRRVQRPERGLVDPGHPAGLGGRRVRAEDPDPRPCQLRRDHPVEEFDVAMPYEFNGTNWHDLGLSPLGQYTVDNFVNFTNFADPAFDELTRVPRRVGPGKRSDLEGGEPDRRRRGGEPHPGDPSLDARQAVDVDGLQMTPLEMSFLRLNNVTIA